MQPSGYGSLSDGRLDATFAALADPTRRAILARLASGEASVRELTEPFAMSQAAVSKHLKVLERAGLISRRRTRSAGRAGSRPRRSPRRTNGSNATDSSGRIPTAARCAARRDEADATKRPRGGTPRHHQAKGEMTMPSTPKQVVQITTPSDEEIASRAASTRRA
jgi:hypothetical protein